MPNVICGILMSIIGSLASASEPKSIALIDALKRAESFSPNLKAAKYQEQATEENITIQNSRYLPDISAAAIASTGQPGAFSLFDVDSDISSTQRLGYGGALVLKETLWDFGRTSNAVKTAEEQKAFIRQQSTLLKVGVDLNVLRTYLACSFLRARIENARFTAEQANMLAKETDHFVRSGQRSIVERYLVDAEAKEAETKIAELSERMVLTEERLGLELGFENSTKMACADLSAIETPLKTLESRLGSNPVLEAQKARIQIAQSKLKEARAESHPTLFGMATGGYFDNEHLHDKFNYSAGVGLRLPLFEGFRIDSTIRQHEAELGAERTNLESTQLSINQSNSGLDEQIQALKVRLDFLQHEKKLANSVFSLAKKRYLNLQGTMIDLRESIRNMNRILQSSDEAYRDLYLARGEKALLNGATVP